MKKQKKCHECNQECCKSVIVEIDKPETPRDWEDVKWEVAHKNVKVFLDNEGDWCIEFLTDCDEMDEKGRCKSYDKRPAVCRGHCPTECIVNGEGGYYKILFNCVEDVEKYLKKHPEAIVEPYEEVIECPKCGHEFIQDE